MYNDLKASIDGTKVLEQEQLILLCEYFKPKVKTESKLKNALSLLKQPTKKFYRDYRSAAKVEDGFLYITTGITLVVIPTQLENGYYNKQLEKLDTKDEPIHYPPVEQIVETVKQDIKIDSDPVCKIPIVIDVNSNTILENGIEVPSQALNILNKIGIENVSIGEQFIYILQDDIILVTIKAY